MFLLFQGGISRFHVSFSGVYFRSSQNTSTHQFHKSFIHGDVSTSLQKLFVRHTLDTSKFLHYISPSFQQIPSLTYPLPQMFVGLHNWEFLTTHFFPRKKVALLQPTWYNGTTMTNQKKQMRMNQHGTWTNMGSIKTSQLGVKFPRGFWWWKVP